MQLLFNLVIVGGALYLIYSIVATIQHDVHQRAIQYSAGMMYDLLSRHPSQISCRRLLYARKILLRIDVNLLSNVSQQCIQFVLRGKLAWDVIPRLLAGMLQAAIMAAYSVNSAKVTAETFAEIVNAFVEPISYKTMVVVVSLLFSHVHRCFLPC